ncbi:MAG: hypothetical protein R3224_01785, partial [Balneolaceae bacterium]|nr:hypothetical protein [Balneolaceae bacterium]
MTALTRFICTLLAVCLLGPACSRSPSEPAVRRVESPAGPTSRLPYLAADDSGRVYMSWVERAGPSEVALKYSRLSGDMWSEPSVISTGSDWFVNWADFPSIAVQNGKPIAA